ncbi:DUF1284 domain-containing protein [Clostridium saccharobutylicum]|uniref:DUF1284 domain-containing protein n=1 Tax=Clostridium saccharobutylicum TaxID=169679 RepID=A0A1S8N2R3_CLOSA|nr:DUF1284 domain-containing protein [Clostridium saccharobutylicum]OOM10601.1 hypothetical protein CLOSAC_32220 [Clostridium saccharobutylicum]
MLLLRPHHINCLFFYKGLGYNKEFVEGMNEISILLKKDSNTALKLVKRCDNLCSNCPNKQLDNICITKEKVDSLDYNTLQVYNLKLNKEYKFKEIIDNIYKNFNKNNFHAICSTCNWYKQGICSDNAIIDQLKNWNL